MRLKELLKRRRLNELLKRRRLKELLKIRRLSSELLDMVLMRRDKLVSGFLLYAVAN